jgi:predicted DNA-binding ribbon-helix-helix protein
LDVEDRSAIECTLLQKEKLMKSKIVKRSIVIDGHKTSVSLEDPFWSCLKEIAYGDRMTLSKMVAAIKLAHQHSNLSSAIRLFVLDRMRGARHSVERLDGAKTDAMIQGSIEVRV